MKTRGQSAKDISETQLEIKKALSDLATQLQSTKSDISLMSDSLANIASLSDSINVNIEENEKEEVTSASKDSTEKIQVISSTTDVNLQDFSSNDAADDFKQNILDNRVNPISTTSNYISSYMTPKPLYAQNDAAKKLANINDDNNSNNNKVIQQLTQTTGASQSMHGSELNATQMQMSLYEIFLTVVHDQKLVVEKKPPAEPPPILSSSQIESLSPIHFECDQLNFKHIRA